ncbi:hypothetical protein [Bradyrhizobium sp. Ai1a-2]|uniref:hypothetical protein n=1 Tax=Bradyrhizobium sp. Ai1a-2 TaxID=196490 RepID=UPI0004050E2D|nr:hypothetical protein [Bradyrhizobium sp. Ai1a-2]
MASKYVLQGLVKWSTRDQWGDRFEQTFEDHLLPACDETGLEIDEIVSTVGEDLFMSTVWACAFEDFLTREFDDGENAIDDYLKRRGWKETASARAYMAALRNSIMSLYEVSDVVPGTSFRLRDLIRGGEAILISERSASRTLKPWDRIAARVVQVGSQAQIGGGLLHYEHATSEAFLEAWREFGKLSKDEKRKLAEDVMGEDSGNKAIPDLSPTEMLRASSPMFTTFWLVEVIDRAEGADIPDLRNSEGDELLLCEAHYPLTAGTTRDDIRAILEARSEFRPRSATSWSWVKLGMPAAASVAREQSQGSLAFETKLEDGTLSLGGVTLEDKTLVLSVNSRRRSDLGCALLSDMLGGRVGQPLIKTETVEEMLASPDAGATQQIDILAEERCMITHDDMDRYYREVLDEPIPMLAGESPRAAVKTDSGRAKVADWLKMLENRTARSDGAMANYSFDWLWTELGINELRR